MPPAEPPFRRVLVANRGEIAVRVFHALRELGIEGIGVHSAVDREALHTTAADRMVDIGGTTAAESYLAIDRILDAAQATEAQAIHPGYGFLSENPTFARAVEDAGLVFIGPSPDAMETLGSKQRAREAAMAAGVPVIPGIHDADLSDGDLRAAAAQLGFPVMVKASAGGGGKGMRRVEDEATFDEALAAGRREAQAAFSDDRMIVEKMVFPARHVEIQIFGDEHGNVVSLGERECSLQRRHQKVLEEAPSPAIDQILRQRMGEAAVAVAKHVGYRNAGTVEFLLGPDGAFYFLEVNTRLQVEHPVTELVTGIDLVHMQLRVAAGGSLVELLAGKDLTPRGHALEARIYAECPEEGFLPAAGKLLRVREPEGPGVRVDSGVESGSEVSVHYDPMLAKIIVHAPDRVTACARLAQALDGAIYLGIPTNVDFLGRIVRDPDFIRGALRTDFVEMKPELVVHDRTEPPDEAFLAAGLCAILAAPESVPEESPGLGAPDPWRDLAAVRLWGRKS